MKRPKLSLISSDRWLAYSIAGLATAAGSTNIAEAEIHYSGIVNLKLEDRTTEVATLPLTSGAALRFYRLPFSTGIADFLGIQGANQGSVGATGRFVDFIVNLPPREKVSGGHFINAKYESHRSRYLFSYYGGGNFSQRGQGFAAFRFDVGHGLQYGWVRVRTVKSAPDDKVVIVDYAWADPGETIETGQGRSRGEEGAAMPAAGSLGLLAHGARGLEASRAARTAGTNGAAIGSGSSAFVLTPVSDPE